MARNKLIHDYLSELEIYLSRISEIQALEVVREIESHIYDSLDLQEKSDNTEIELILARLGTPRDLAAGYIEHVTTGAAPPKGLKPLSGIRKGISKSIYYLIVSVGFGISIALITAAMVKLISPSIFSVWIAEHGNSLIISFSQADQSAQDLGTVWVTSTAILIGFSTFYLTSRISRILKMHI
ncbi:HAAS signaling domain-containing protein [Microbulbifer sp. 2201CG32-9]|uniref:HAAS signaling domain-containing protein n=1 Tax=Microbulbifer sp. 2201CG32-9 TaxID=3232309 RepID=UPI00345B8AD7